MKSVFLLLAIVGLALAAPQGGRITNGENAVQGQFPYQVSIQWGIFGSVQHLCGGSIISEEWILTAGHCVTEIPYQGDMSILAGIYKLNEKGDHIQSIKVVERIVNPDYQGGVNPNDIALLRLETKLQWNDLVQPIKLPEANVLPTGKSILSGWGSISTSIFPNMPNTLQTAELEIITITECKDAFTELLGTPEPLADTNVCTGPLHQSLSACSGDSGGPLAQDGQVIGIVSWGIVPCGTDGAPSVFTQVSSFRDFITKITGL